MDALFWMVTTASQAVVQYLVTKAADHGYSKLQGAIEQVVIARDQADSEGASTHLRVEVWRHPDQAHQLVSDVLELVSTPDDRLSESTFAELGVYIDTLLAMTAKLPDQIVALPGALCSAEAVTVIDVRKSSRGTFLGPTEADPKWLLLGGNSAMWVIRPPEPGIDTTIVTTLNARFESLSEDAEVSTKLLAEWAGVPTEGAQYVARILGFDGKQLDCNLGDSEIGHIPLTYERTGNPATDFAAKLANSRANDADKAERRAQMEQELDNAGLTSDFLKLDERGILRLRESILLPYEEAIHNLEQIRMTEIIRERKALDALKKANTSGNMGES